MPIEYLGLSNINGPLIAMEGIQDAFYDEIVEFVVMVRKEESDVSLSCMKIKP